MPLPNKKISRNKLGDRVYRVMGRNRTIKSVQDRAREKIYRGLSRGIAEGKRQVEHDLNTKGYTTYDTPQKNAYNAMRQTFGSGLGRAPGYEPAPKTKRIPSPPVAPKKGR